MIRSSKIPPRSFVNTVKTAPLLAKLTISAVVTLSKYGMQSLPGNVMLTSEVGLCHYYNCLPVISVCNICDTSNSDAFVLVYTWLLAIPWSLYWTGNRNPPKLTIFPPFSTWKSYKAVFDSSCATVESGLKLVLASDVSNLRDSMLATVSLIFVNRWGQRLVIKEDDIQSAPQQLYYLFIYYYLSGYSNRWRWGIDSVRDKVATPYGVSRSSRQAPTQSAFKGQLIDLYARSVL